MHIILLVLHETIFMSLEIIIPDLKLNWPSLGKIGSIWVIFEGFLIISDHYFVLISYILIDDYI